MSISSSGLFDDTKLCEGFNTSEPLSIVISVLLSLVLAAHQTVYHISRLPSIAFSNSW